MKLAWAWIVPTLFLPTSVVHGAGREPAEALGQDAAPAGGATAPAADFDREIAPVLAMYCAGCHGGGEPEAGLVLDLRTEAAAREAATHDADLWGRVVDELEAGRMPPSRSEHRLTVDDRRRLVSWISARLLDAGDEPNPGPLMIRRLNNQQFANTVRDLLYLPPDYNAAADFPADERGDGFDNNAATLTISPLLIENYLAAVERAAVAAMGLDTRQPPEVRAALESRKRLNEPSAHLKVDFANSQEKIRLNLEAFAPRAFRRPVSSQEIDDLMKFAAVSFAHSGESQDEATALVIRATLMSPEFLFRLEYGPGPGPEAANGSDAGAIFAIDEYQLASRLSYFLWNTMPDTRLFDAARTGRLRAELDQQVARMLADPRAISLTRDFLGQWLEIRGMREVTNTPASLLASMQGETEHVFDYIVRNDRSVMEFLESDYTFVNKELAELYGISSPGGTGFQKVAVDRGQRGGILTQASFLTLTSKPLGRTRRTSPVLRGKWILENLLGQKIPAPPPDVPELALDTNKELKGTVRQIFEQHRADLACASCHARMDPYGFALENYDGYGAWRVLDQGEPVDPTGEIDGSHFQNPVEFRRLIANRSGDFRRTLVRKILSYAVGRGLQPYDHAAVESICESVKASGDRFSSVILGVVRSYPFQHARGMGLQTPGNRAQDERWYDPSR